MSVRPAWLPCTKVEDPASKVGVSYFDRLAVVDASGANVNRCGGEATHIGEQVVFGVMCEVVGLGDAEGRIGGDVDFCSKGVADPADAEFAESRRRGQAVRLPRMMLSKPLFPESMVPPMRKRRRSIGARIKPSGVGRVGLRADGAGDGCRARMRPRTSAMTSATAFPAQRVMRAAPSPDVYAGEPHTGAGESDLGPCLDGAVDADPSQVLISTPDRASTRSEPDTTSGGTIPLDLRRPGRHTSVRSATSEPGSRSADALGSASHR